MTTDENKLEILRKVENGSLSIEEGSELIGLLEQTNTESDDLPKKPIENREASGCWKAAWSMFLVGGTILAGFSAYWIYQGYSRNGFGWGFWLSWIPMLIGIGLMIFGWALMESPWMHVKVRSRENGKNINFVISMPVPFNMVRWVMDNFGHYMPENVNSQEILDVIEQAESSIKKGEPFQVQVDDDKEGSKVDITIN